MKQIKIDVTYKDQQVIIQILHKLVPNYEVWGFGSRVKWMAKSSSDLDLAIVAKDNNCISYQQIYQLKDAFRESDLPFSVDVVDFNRASTTFQEIIRQKYIVIYTPYQHEKVKLRFKTDDGSDHPDWKDTVLSDVGQIVGGGTPDTTNDKYWGHDIAWFTPTEINTKYVNSSMRYITKLGLQCSSAKLLPINTILITTRASIGTVAISKVPCSTNQGFQSLIVNNDHSHEFWYYQLSIMKNILSSHASGSTFLEISKNSLLQLVATVPSMPEQQKIAEFLTSVDDLIKSIKQQLDLMKQYKQGVMQQIFSQRLRFTADDGSDYPDWKQDVQRNIGIEIIDGDRGINYPSAIDFNYDLGYCLFLNAKNVTKRGFYFIDKMFITKEKDKLLKKGKLNRCDIVLTTRGSVGNVAYYDMQIPFEDIRINSGMVIIRTNNIVIDSNYLFKYYSSYYVQNMISQISFGSAQPQLTVKEIANIKICYPSLPEQQKIADFLTSIDDIIQQQTSKLEQTELYKKALLQQMLI